MHSVSKTLDVPYASYFWNEEKWEILDVEDSTDKCLLVC